MEEKMTRERLASYRALRREITRSKKRLARLKNEESLSAQKMKEAIGRYMAEAEREASEIAGFITHIKDGNVREIFMLRYFDCISSWQKIAFLVGEHDESYVRRLHNTYLKTCNL